MQGRVIIRNILTNSVEFQSDWFPGEEIDEVRAVLMKPCFFGDSRVYEKEIEYKQEYAIHWTDLFGYGYEPKKCYEDKDEAIKIANRRFMADTYWTRVFVTDESTGEIVFMMERAL